MNVTFTPSLSLEMYAQPFFASNDFGALKELREPRTYDFLEYGVAPRPIRVLYDRRHSAFTRLTPEIAALAAVSALATFRDDPSLAARVREAGERCDDAAVRDLAGFHSRRRPGSSPETDGDLLGARGPERAGARASAGEAARPVGPAADRAGLRRFWTFRHGGQSASGRPRCQAATQCLIPVKAGLQMAGLIPTDRLRLPLLSAEPEQRDAVRAALDQVGVAVAG